MFLKIDSREKQVVEFAKAFAERNGIKSEVYKLSTGDYVFQEGTKTVKFERKRIDDFVSSVKGGKIFRQVSEMDGDFNFVIITDYKDLPTVLQRINNFSKKRMTKEHIIKAICRLNTMCDGVIVNYPNKPNEDLYWMLTQAEKCFSADTKKYGVQTDKKKGENPAVNFLASIKGISYKKAETICDYFNIKTLTDLLGLTKTYLVKCPGIGEKTAETIIEALE